MATVWIRVERCIYCGEFIWLCNGWQCGGKTVRRA